MRLSARDILGLGKVPVFLTADPLHIFYLTGLRVSAGILLIRTVGTTLFVDGRYREIVQRHKPEGIRIGSWNALENAMSGVSSCGFEEERVSFAQLLRWKKKFKNTKFVQTFMLLEGIRRKKSLEELKRINHAESITEELLRRVHLALRFLPTERELALKLELWARELGAEGLSFDPIVAFGSHTSLPHHRPTSRKLKKGHIVQIDVGAKYQGYCADRSDVFFTAHPTPLQEKTFRAVEEAKDTAKAAVRTGITNHDLDRIARRVLRRYGLEAYFVHGLGHGVGLEIHEGVSLSEKAPEEKLLENEVITIEPGVYFPGKFGIRLEDMVVVR